MRKIVLFISFGLLLLSSVLADTKCFLVIENDKIIEQEGDCKSRHAPCSTFKIAISLMGYNEGLLIDETHPELPFKKDYVSSLEFWRQSHNPVLWMKNSCVWYSQRITKKLGMQTFKEYVEKFNYGNQDVTGDQGKNNGLTNAWLSSSLQISPGEQIEFLQKLINNKLPVSLHSQVMTRNIMFVEDLENGWKLYGKTGSGSFVSKVEENNKYNQMGWFIGWVQKGGRIVIFTHYIEEDNQDVLAGRRAKEIAKEKLLHLLQG